MLPDFSPLREHGAVAIGGDLSPKTLVWAYMRGIYPSPVGDDVPIIWFSPDPRCLLEHKNLHIPKSLRRLLRKNEFEVVINKNFEAIITHCATVHRKDQPTTWITPNMLSAYISLHKAGLAHSVECYHGGELVGGLYGVFIKNVFSGESMFYLKSNAAKIALLSLMERLHEHGIEWVDTQMFTPTVEALGAKEIPKREFMELLHEAHRAPVVNPFEEKF